MSDKKTFKQHLQEAMEQGRLSGDYESPTAMRWAEQAALEGDFEKARQISKTGTIGAAMGIGAGLNAHSLLTYGLWPTLLSNIGAYAGGEAGHAIGNKIDKHYDTKWVAPTLSFAGGLYGGGKGWNTAIKTTAKGWIPRTSVLTTTDKFVSSQVAPQMFNQSVNNTVLKPISQFGDRIIPYDAKINREKLVDTFLKAKWDVEHSAKISEAERLGIPKAERNAKFNSKDPFITNFLKSSPTQSNDVYPRGLKMDGRRENFISRSINPDEIIKFNRMLQGYINSIPKTTTIHPLFKSMPNDRPSVAVWGYRNYLHNLGLDAADIGNDDLARFLTHYYETLSKGASGKLANRILWHGSPKWFDSFDFKYTGSNTGNSGVLGPGNYFSTHGAIYGSKNNGKFLELGNFQPYVISGITSTPNGPKMQAKGILPQSMSKTMLGSPHNKALLQRQLVNMPINDTNAYLDPNEVVHGFLQGPQYGVLIRRNSGIKSLYPHPSRLIQNSDDTISLLPTDWSDVRVNFKNGGVLYKRDIKNTVK